MPIVSGGGGSSAGGLHTVFDSTLGADTASIDTGAGGIAAGIGVLFVWAIVRTDDVAATAVVNMNVNNDGGANYDSEGIAGVNAAASAGPTLAATSWTFTAHGSGGGASYPTVIEVRIPAYDGTTFFKAGNCLFETVDSTAANARQQANGLVWRNTAAITRIAVSATGAAKLKAGSRLIVCGSA